MNADPRIAALAEAVHRIDSHSPGAGCASCERRAAAILAELPPDWCGHGAFMDTAALRVEISRLRKIEEAARKFMDQEVSWIGDRPYYVYTGRPPIGTMDALRAALEADHA